jgi:hypothetical protein
MLTLFGGLVAITSIPELADGQLFAVVPILVGGGGFVVGALALYGSHLRRH